MDNFDTIKLTAELVEEANTAGFYIDRVEKCRWNADNTEIYFTKLTEKIQSWEVFISINTSGYVFASCAFPKGQGCQGREIKHPRDLGDFIEEFYAAGNN